MKFDGGVIERYDMVISKKIVFGDAALFAAIPHEPREDYWFVFYSERMDTTWIMTSEEFIKESVQNKTGKNKGKRSIWLNGKKTDRSTGEKFEYCKQQFEKYVAKNFNRLKGLEVNDDFS